MPVAIAAAVAAAFPSTAAWGLTLAVGSTVVGTASFATLIGYAATIGGTIAYGQSQANRLRNQSKGSVDQGRSVMARDPLAARRLIYGQVLVTGPVVFMTTSGTKNQWLHMCIALAGHEVSEIGTIYFDNGEEVPLDGAGAATGKYAGKFYCTKHNGTASQAVDGSINGHVPTEWTTDHRLRGIAYLAVSFYYDTDLFPNGVPTVKALVKGKKVFDPRDGGQSSGTPSTWAWSDNSALCTADYLNDSTFGRGIPWARINTTGLSAEANVCDENVVLADASTEHRYKCNGTTTSEQNALNDIVASMAGRVVETGGIWSVQAGAYRTPGSMVITDDLIVGPFNVQTRQSMRETFNGVKGTYISATNDWMPADFPAVKNDTYKSQDGGVRRWKDVSYPFVTSYAAAQRISKIDLERGRQQIIVNTVLRLDAFKLACGDTVKVTRASLGWSEKLFEVVEWKFQIMDSNALGVAVTLKETAEAVWDWADGEETTVDLAPNTTLPDPTVVGAPTLTLLTDSTTATIQNDGTVQPRLKVSWTTPNNIYVENGGYVEIEFKKTTDSDYTVWSVIRGDALFDYILDVKVGVQYDVRARFRNQAGVRGAYGSGTSSAVVGDTTTPNAATSLSATPRAGFIDLNWTPSTSGTVNEYKIYRSIVSAVAGFALLAQTANSQYQDSSVSAGTTYWYYVVAESVVGNGSAASSVVSAAAIFAPNGTVPSNPTAPAQPGSPVVGTYASGDGTLMAYVTLDIAALPSNGIWQNLLYRRSGAGDWMVGAQFKNTGTTTTRLDDLTPGIVYDIATQAWNGAGGSSVVTGSSFTAATASAPSAPTNIAYIAGDASNYNEKATFGSLGARFAALASWDIPSDKSVTKWQWVLTTTDSNGAADAAANPVGPGAQPNYVSEPRVVVSKDILGFGGYFRVRAINGSGVASSWAGGGTNLDTATLKRPVVLGTAASKDIGTTAGTAAAGDDSRITGSAQKASNLSDLVSASTARSNLGFRASISHVQTVPGGSPTYVFSYTHNFGVLQDKVLVQVVAVAAGALDMTEYLVQHDYGNGGNTTNVAYFVISTKSGVNLTSQSVRMTINWLP